MTQDMTTDVNVQFDTQRAGQITSAYAAVEAAEKYNASLGDRQREFSDQMRARIDSGEIRDNGNGTYTVLAGWDRGETLRSYQPTPQSTALILPQHGMDEMGNGQIALYSAQPEWHSLGQIIPGGTSDIGTVLDLSGTDFQVEKRAARYAWDGEVREVPGQFVTVRTDTGGPLGVVGNIYNPVQNEDAFEFLGALTGNGDLIIESAGCLRGGRRVFVSARLPENVVVDADGIHDIVVPHVAAFNTHDGTTPFQVVVTPWRPRCSNTERLALSSAVTRWSVRHTTNALRKIEQARQTLGMTVRYYERFAAEETTLAQTAITDAEFEALVAEMFPPAEDPSKRAATISERRSTQLWEGFGTEISRVGKTRYAAERAFTDWVDHVSPRRAGSDGLAAARASAILEGSDDDLKSKVHQRLMLTNR